MPRASSTTLNFSIVDLLGVIWFPRRNIRSEVEEVTGSEP